MLRKLLKWEIKSTARILLPLYLTLLLFTFINRALNPIEIINESVGLSLQTFFISIALLTYVALVIAVAAMTTVIMLQRFYKSLLQDEGYLMFTLPIATWKHIASKLIVAAMWTILSVLITFGSALIMANIDNALGELAAQIGLLKDTMGSTFMYILPIGALLLVAVNIMMIYTAITLGHTFNKHKLIASFGMYGVLYIINQIIVIISILILGSTVFKGFEVAPTAFQANVILIMYVMYSVILTAVLFAVNNVFLKKKLNLE